VVNRNAYRRLNPVVVVLLGFMAFACNSGSEPLQATTTSPTPASTPTPFVSAAATLTPTVGEFGSFTMDAPAGWEMQTTRIPGGFAQEYIFNNEHGTRVALISVQCKVGVSIDSMMTLDQRVVQGVGGRYVRATATQLNFAGTIAKQLDYGVSLAGIPVNYRSIYFYTEPCGWRLTLAVFGAGLFDQFIPLFYRAVSTFRPATFDVPFEDRDPYAGQSQSQDGQ
jgi:hypothetical protein